MLNKHFEKKLVLWELWEGLSLYYIRNLTSSQITY